MEQLLDLFRNLKTENSSEADPCLTFFENIKNYCDNMKPIIEAQKKRDKELKESIFNDHSESEKAIARVFKQQYEELIRGSIFPIPEFDKLCGIVNSKRQQGSTRYHIILPRVAGAVESNLAAVNSAEVEHLHLHWINIVRFIAHNMYLTYDDSENNSFPKFMRKFMQDFNNKENQAYMQKGKIYDLFKNLLNILTDDAKIALENLIKSILDYIRHELEAQNKEEQV